jgi:putative colanic acid biosynthesis glycosyltransferase
LNRVDTHSSQCENDNRMPLVSIITVVFNNEKDIEQSILSVINQSYENIEYIIIDGGSTDNTVNIVKKYEEHISRWISEPDSGIYDAMNKGIDLSSGAWLFFLNSDDSLSNREIIQKIFEHDVSSYDLLNGKVMFNDISKRLFVSRYNRKLYYKNTLSHQGTFYKRALFKDFRYDLHSKVSADYELNLKSYVEHKSLKEIEEIIAICGNQGISKQVLYSGYKEEVIIRSKYLEDPLKTIFNMLTYLRYFYKLNGYLLKRIGL